MTGFSKREVLFGTLLAASARPARARVGESTSLAGLMPQAAPGRFDASIASLETYQTPDWFRDAKFGIWSHWGPQAVPGQGDWYARNLYIPGHPHYDHHVKTYGHPSAFGYKDIIPLWKAERFDPEALMARYAAAGAKYFVSMGVHHDNFDLWNSKHHRWNAAQMGPKRDIVGAWQAAAKRHGLRFGVSEHLGASYCWWYPNHQFDQFWTSGKMGVDYDGADPKFVDLYHDNRTEPYRGNGQTWYTTNPKFQRHWFDRITDLIDNYQPDLLYSDGGIPFGEVGRAMVAHLYNRKAGRGGRTEAVYAHKSMSGEFLPKAAVQDVERGVLEGINPLPWQTDTSNGDWFYNRNDKFKTTREVLSMLADIVAKNGNLLLNIVQHPDGSLSPQSEELLTGLTAWMKVNAEAIHGTRPWRLYGEGPTVAKAGHFAESGNYTADDVRFTTKGGALYAILLGWPQGESAIKALGSQALPGARIERIDLLGGPKLRFAQGADALRLALPAGDPTVLPVLRIRGRGFS
ncbi:alpha-L-fucosidase [Sphingomonas spermidinifaciens]|uniref:alpha-L-fucosidase n=1 Tax=Sphingomonas spermidinifaciens TaxID=1141889 RepID=A0A2A4BA72_9SPHN|nr:alpha-L-fucosidase [Sphingomonas spermidinifaciens]PCD04708.1 alpha-L-fucosidase [Sphingomonas spermidinifaciens]